MPWNIEDFDLDDEINRGIWNRSPDLQREAHAQTDDNEAHRFDGSYGCQQAMTEAEGFSEVPLPWVPDLVGKNYGKKSSLLIVGSAYAPFLIGYGGRQAVEPSTYRKLAERGSVGRFLDEQFLPNVVNDDDGHYYDKISAVLGYEDGVNPIISPRAIAITDLCRGSFVYRPNNQPTEDIFGDRVIDESDPRIPAEADPQCRRMFDTYFRGENRYGWLNRRIQNDGLRVVLALGLIAEYGLLRRFHELGAQVRENESVAEFIPRNHQLPWNWVGQYAHLGFNLGYWNAPNRWWDVSFGNRLFLRILPTYHPSAREWTDDYEDSLQQRLTSMLAHEL